MSTEPEKITEEDQVIGHIASNMLNGITFRQQIDIIRDFCFLKAEQYYQNLNEEETEKINQKVKEALKAQPETQPS